MRLQHVLLGLVLMGCDGVLMNGSGEHDPDEPATLGGLEPAGGGRLLGGEGGGVASMPSIADEALGRRGFLRFDDPLSTGIVSNNGLRLDVLVPGGLRTEEDVAELLEYSVRCMLANDQRLDVEYMASDGTARSETFVGNLGLEPAWGEQPLSDAGRLWWLACLGAHATAVDTPQEVPIAPRSDGHVALAGSAPSAYAHQQGAFWAEMEGDAFQIYSCQGSSFNSSESFLQRFCTSGDSAVRCGDTIRYVGICEEPTGPLVAYVCESAVQSQDGLHVDLCHRAASVSGWSDEPHTQVVTAYVE